MPATDDARILVDAAASDDAAVFRYTDDRALVATADFFTPIVDDAFTFGSIAAANALSDVYAMGGKPLFALNLMAWPRDPSMLKLAAEAVRGGAEKVSEAGAFIVGGHTIDDNEPKYGLVVLGEVHPDRMFVCGSTRPGDRLVLTKPLGTGVLSTALKREMIDEDAMRPAIQSMETLNAGAARAVERVRTHVSGVTDVTGFGLLGHLRNLLGSSGAGALVNVSLLPVFEGVVDLIEQGAVPAGTDRNLKSAGRFVTWGDGVDHVLKTIAADAQTSGGLLVAVHPEGVRELMEALLDEGASAAVEIGEIKAGGSVELTA